MYCSNCGKQTNNEDIFCDNCGAKIPEIDKIEEKQQDVTNDKKNIKITLKRIIIIAIFFLLLIFIIACIITYTNKNSTVLPEKSNIDYNSNVSNNNIANSKNTVNNSNENNNITNNKNTIDNTITNNTNNSENLDTNKEEIKEYGVWKYKTEFRNDYQKSLCEKFEVKFMYYSENYFIEIPTVSKYPNLNKELQKLKNEVLEYAKDNPNLYYYNINTDISGYSDNDNLYDFRIVRSLKEKENVGFDKTASYHIKYDIDKDYIIYVKDFDGVVTVDTPI